jgi:hypothetical protein
MFSDDILRSYRIGSLLPVAEDNHQFLQKYFMSDSENESKQRCSNIPKVREVIVKQLQKFLHFNNAYVKLFKTVLEHMSNDDYTIVFRADKTPTGEHMPNDDYTNVIRADKTPTGEHMPNDDYTIVIRADKTPTGEHKRRFNAPTIDEVAIIVVGDNFQKIDIIIHKRNNNLQRVADTHRSYDALQYPIIFWQGEDGYYFGISKNDPSINQPISNKKYSHVVLCSIETRCVVFYRVTLRFVSYGHVVFCFI